MAHSTFVPVPATGEYTGLAFSSLHHQTTVAFFSSDSVPPPRQPSNHAGIGAPICRMPGVGNAVLAAPSPAVAVADRTSRGWQLTKEDSARVVGL